MGTLLPVPAALAVALAHLLGLALLAAAEAFLAFHPGEVVVLSRLPAFALLRSGLVLPFAVLLAPLVARHAAVLVAIGHRLLAFHKGSNGHAAD